MYVEQKVDFMIQGYKHKNFVQKFLDFKPI